MALRKNAKIELLKRVPLFAGCSKKELAEIALIADEVDVKEGTRLITEGSRGTEFFILLDDQPSLDFGGKRFDDEQGAAAFGRVVSGLDVVKTINQQGPLQEQNRQQLATPVPITSIKRAR